MQGPRADPQGSSLKEQLLQLLRVTPGLTDREITCRLRGASAPQQPVNQLARALAQKGIISRERRPDGLLGNYPALVTSSGPGVQFVQRTIPVSTELLGEDELKRHLENWLLSSGWQVHIAWGKQPGVDIFATNGGRRWFIEVKGCGSLNAMRVNYFLSILGEMLQRMRYEDAKYSIALPDLPQFRGLWARLPDLAKKRTTIDVLFVSADGAIDTSA